MSENGEQLKTASLPGLNFDESEYGFIEVGKRKLRKIPFSDWLPRDFEDVLCTIGDSDELKIGYYSPGSNAMFVELSGVETKFNVEKMGYWLKPVVE